MNIIPNMAGLLMLILGCCMVATASAATLAQCYFSFGDSLVDNGNNNNLVTRQKCNYPPYGVDFRDGATGRFGNGETIADYITLNLGFRDYIPPYANISGRDILLGVNYGSGACGIRDESGKAEGDCISFNRQLGNHALIRARIGLRLRGLRRADEHLGKCLYTVAIGSNDYLNNYFANSPLYYIRPFLTPEQFADALIRQYSRQLEKLYGYGARKFALFSLTALGGALAVVNKPRNASDYVEPQTITDASELFNIRLRPMVDNLNREYPDAKFIYLNSTSLRIGDPSLAALRVVDRPCCSQLLPDTGLCVPNSNPCPNRSEYLFFDNYHLNRDLNPGLVRRAFNATLPTDAYPTDITTLLRS